MALEYDLRGNIRNKLLEIFNSTIYDSRISISEYHVTIETKETLHRKKLEQLLHLEQSLDLSMNIRTEARIEELLYPYLIISFRSK